MNNKKGFTLVELLAVIAILAILVVIALPNVIGMFQGAKKGTFKTEVQTIMKQAQSTWVLDGGGAAVYTNCMNGISTSNQTSLQLQGTEFTYYISVGSDGEFDQVSVAGSDYAFSTSIPGSSDGKVASKITEDMIYSSSVNDQKANYDLAVAAAKSSPNEACTAPVSTVSGG